MTTARQKELLAFIVRYHADHGIAPSYDEMRDALGLTSKSGVHRLVTGLEDRGCIVRLPYRNRCIEVVPEADRAIQRQYRELRRQVREARDLLRRGDLATAREVLERAA